MPRGLVQPTRGGSCEKGNSRTGACQVPEAALVLRAVQAIESAVASAGKVRPLSPPRLPLVILWGPPGPSPLACRRCGPQRPNPRLKARPRPRRSWCIATRGWAELAWSSPASWCTPRYFLLPFFAFCSRFRRLIAASEVCRRGAGALGLTFSLFSLRTLDLRPWMPPTPWRG